jgi:glycosyltransferase involved in cell wall biosynthesis
MVKERHLGQRVTMIGSIPIERVAETMADVDIGIVPKRADSFGNEAFSTKIMEFMATGVPVVAAKTAVDQYYFGDRLVQFFEPGSADDFAAKLLELLNDSMARKELSARALEFIQSNNWDVKKKEYLDLLDQLVKPQIKPIYAATNG